MSTVTKRPYFLYYSRNIAPRRHRISLPACSPVRQHHSHPKPQLPREQSVEGWDISGIPFPDDLVTQSIGLLERPRWCRRLMAYTILISPSHEPQSISI